MSNIRNATPALAAHSPSKIRPADFAFVRREVLSDGSVAWNVVCEGSDLSACITIACVSQRHADELAYYLNAAAWIDVDVAAVASSGVQL
jgi:hypothetical protein